MSGPDHHAFTLNFLALKKLDFSFFRGQKKVEKKFHKKCIMQLFSANAVVFFKKNFQKFLTPKK